MSIFALAARHAPTPATSGEGRWRDVGPTERAIPGIDYRTVYYVAGPLRTVLGRLGALDRAVSKHYVAKGAQVTAVEVYQGAPVMMPGRRGMGVATTPVIVSWHLPGSIESTTAVQQASIAGIVTVLAVGAGAAIALAISFSVVATAVQKHGQAVESAIDTAAEAAKDTVFNPGVLILVALIAALALTHGKLGGVP